MIDCKSMADEILNSITGHGCLAVISVGNDPASQSYIKGKKKDCERVGFEFRHFHYEDDISVTTGKITNKIFELNSDPTVTGIIIQLPLPPHLNADLLCSRIVPEKDVDGFRPDSPFKPCTPEGIVHILEHEMGSLTSKHAVIIGRGKQVGKPLMQMLLDKNMTVSVCHSKTTQYDIDCLSVNADAIIVATGKPNYFIFDQISTDCVVVDCGIHRMKNGKLCGDVLSADTDYRTPVPGGVGLLTRAMLMKHVERK